MTEFGSPLKLFVLAESAGSSFIENAAARTENIVSINIAVMEM